MIKRLRNLLVSAFLEHSIAEDIEFRIETDDAERDLYVYKCGKIRHVYPGLHCQRKKSTVS